MIHRALFFCLLALGCSGCHLLRGGDGPSSPPEKYLMSPGARTPASVQRGSEQVVEPVMPTLYGRDGSPVTAQPAGTVVNDRAPTHELEEPDGSRMYILELYQQAIEARESLEMEVEALTAALDKANDALEQSAYQNDEMKKLVEKQAGQIERLENQGLGLASRLTTAQIRRLEAEKLLLEAKLEWQRLQETLRQQESRDPEIENPRGGGR